MGIYNWNYEVLRDFCGNIKSRKEEFIDTKYTVIDKNTHLENLEMISRFPEFMEKYFPDKCERHERGMALMNNSHALRSMINRVLNGDYDILRSTGAVSVLMMLLYDEFPGLMEIASNTIKNDMHDINNSMYDLAISCNTDYMDMNTGYLYLIQEYNRAVKMGLPVIGIRVIDSMSGEFIGWAY